MKSIIKWNKVNMRSKNDKNLPEIDSLVIYYDNGIYDGYTINVKGKLFIFNGFQNVNIKTGLLWCYQKDITLEES